MISLSMLRTLFSFLIVVLCSASVLATEETKKDYSDDGPAVIAHLASQSLLLDSYAQDDLAVAVGERGHILVSTDNGHLWKQANVPTRATLTAVYFHDKQTGWVVGHDAVILKTVDGGNTWNKVYSDPGQERPLLDVWFSDASHGFAIGAYGYFLKTVDGGATWESIYISEDDFHLNHISRANNGDLYIAAEAGLIYLSVDAGLGWKLLNTPYEGSFFNVLPLADGSLLIAGLRGHLFRSEDAGQVWTKIETHTEAILTDAIQLGENIVLVSGLAGTVLVSRDGGKTFQLHQQADRKGISSIIQTGDGTLVAVGEGGINKLKLDFGE